MRHIVLSKKADKLSAAPWLFLLLIILALCAVTFASVIPRSLAAQVTMEVYQQDGRKVFGQATSLDIFDDPRLGGQKLVHPFSKGSYTFAVFNNSNSDPLPYSLDIKGTNPDEIPLVFSVQKNGVHVYGGSGITNMLPLSEIIFPETNLGSNRTDLYTIKWEWKTENDVIDTAIGNDGTQLYKLTITATGSVDETTVPLPKTGDTFHIFVWLIVLLASTSFLFILLFCRRRKDEDENNQTVAKNG